jgi:plastocyanin
MRWWIFRGVGLAAIVALATVGVVGSATAASKAPVNLGEKVNNKGIKDVSAQKKAQLDVELDDFYFEPTFIKAKAGQKITIEAENEGSVLHTFTSTKLKVDKQLQAGKKATFTVTVPKSGAVFEFHCDLHVSQGMAGGVYTKVGGTASSSSSSSSTNSSSGTQVSSSGGIPGY